MVMWRKLRSSPAKAADTPTTQRTAGDALREFRVAIEQHDRAVVEIDDLRDSLRDYCALARHEHLTPERVVVAVKEVVDAIPTRADEAVIARQSVKERVVTLAIESYFADLPGHG